jgi:hypothetical protein
MGSVRQMQADKHGAYDIGPPLRCGVPWLGDKNRNRRMRKAVWVYRFVPEVTSTHVQKTFGVAVKTLMRYVFRSTVEEYGKFGLFFGAPDAAPHTYDRLAYLQNLISHKAWKVKNPGRSWTKIEHAATNHAFGDEDALNWIRAQKARISQINMNKKKKKKTKKKKKKGTATAVTTANTA